MPVRLFKHVTRVLRSSCFRGRVCWPVPVYPPLPLL